MQKSGDFLQEDYFANTGGMNITDSPFAVKSDQTTGGFNFEYVRTGGFAKSKSPNKINASASISLRTLGMALYNSKTGNKKIVRFSNSRVETLELTGPYTALAKDDMAASTAIFDADIPVSSVMFSSPNSDVLWSVGGGASRPVGVVNGTQVTESGVAVPTGLISGVVSALGGSFISPGAYRYAVAFRKRSTQAISNVALEIGVTVSATTDKVNITLSGTTNNDTTLYDKIYLYRSAVGGAIGFTTGDLVAQIDSTAIMYTDTGSSISPATPVPRAGNSVLDNSQLAEGNYQAIDIYRNRLVVAKDNVVYISDVNKPESFIAQVEIPYGGPVKALKKISFVTPSSSVTNEEILGVWTDERVAVITGTTSEDLSLKFVDNAGCAAQNLVVQANGYLYWMDQRGIYLWDGAGKPVYISRPIEGLFNDQGDLDKTQLQLGFGAFYKKQNEVIWYLSHKIFGIQKFMLKLDLRLTLPRVSDTLGERVLDGVFIPGKTTKPMYGGSAFIYPISPSLIDEVYITADDEGNTWRQFYDFSGTGNDAEFQYESAFLNQDKPGIAKRYLKVIAWVDNVGDWPLVLDWWTNYKTGRSEYDTLPVRIVKPRKAALWDVAIWDEALWDDFSPRPIALVYNIRSDIGNSEGDSIKVRFRNAGTNEPVTVNGFSIVYQPAGIRK